MTIGAWSPLPVIVTVAGVLRQPEWLSACRLVACASGLEMLTQPVLMASTLPAASVAQ